MIKKEILKALYSSVPWTLQIITIVSDGGWANLIYDENKHYFAVKNQWDEWICFVESKEAFSILMQKILTYVKENRIVIFAKEDIFDDFGSDNNDIVYWIEDFMCHKPSLQQKQDYYLATEKDIPVLASRQVEYTLEEINWKAYHVDKYRYQRVYRRKLESTMVFVDGAGIYSKAEVSDIHGDFGRVCSVYTVPSQRGKGLATQCLRGVLTWAAEENIYLCLNVEQSNEVAKKMYYNMGFRQNGKVLYIRSK